MVIRRRSWRSTSAAAVLNTPPPGAPRLAPSARVAARTPVNRPEPSRTGTLPCKCAALRLQSRPMTASGILAGDMWRTRNGCACEKMRYPHLATSVRLHGDYPCRTSVLTSTCGMIKIDYRTESNLNRQIGRVSNKTLAAERLLG